MKLVNTASDWSEVLGQRLIERITSKLEGPYTWDIEDMVEADQAGWFAHAQSGSTRLVLALTIPSGTTTAPPPPAIEWTLVAEASRSDTDSIGRTLLAAIMVGCGIALGTSAWVLQGPEHLLRRIALSALAGGIGVFPIGLALAIAALRPRALRRGKRSVSGGKAFLQEVSKAVAKLR